MSFLKSLIDSIFKTKPDKGPTYEPLDDAPQLIQCVTANGTTVQMTRDDYYESYLTGLFKRAWDDPDQLAAAIHLALDDDFIGESLEPARQLRRIDPQPHRGVVYLAAILLRLDRASEVQSLLETHLEQHGEDGVVLTNLAKAYSYTGDTERADQTLWRALECNPNQENGFYWYVTGQVELGGDDARLAALKKIADLPGSWLALLHLARYSLEQQDRAAAVELYRRVLERAPAPKASMLQQISGDLGLAGFAADAIELCAPHFDPNEHGLTVGNNLIRAYMEIGKPDQAKSIIAQLRALDRSDWVSTLEDLELEVESSRNRGSAD